VRRVEHLEVLDSNSPQEVMRHQTEAAAVVAAVKMHC
jgi:hypothetical protein